MPQRIMMVFLVFWLSVVGIFPAYGAQPLDTLKGPIDKVVAILNDPQYKDSAQRHRQHEHLWQVIREVFDFNMISRLSLARNWKELPPAEQKEFSAVFSEFLGNTYIGKIQGEYRDEKVVFLEQETLTASKAAVKTKIIRKDVEVPIEYRMYKPQDTWKIYDVNIEGVSLVKNYRDQFRKILLKESPRQLIERLKKKLDAQQKKIATDDKI